MTRISIGIDGYNFAMPNGTGVATYGMALHEAVRSLELDTVGVFGVPVGANPALREVLYYEGIGRGYAQPQGWKPWRTLTETVRAARRQQALPVPQTGLVRRESFADRLPAFDRVVSAPFLFERGERHFKRTGRLLDVTMPDPPAVMHWTYPVPVRLQGARNVYTLHDLVPLRLPHTTLDRKRYYHRLITACVATADHICTVSDASRADIVASFGEPPGGITNTYQHSPIPDALLATSPLADAADIEGIFGLERRGYFLYFGAIEPKKNVGRLVEAYLSTRTATPLVIVGARAWQAEADLRLIALDQGKGTEGARTPRIRQLDYLPRRLLLKLVRGAKAVVFPSLYEGFGLPVLEAMQLGTPVLTADRSSLPEVVGDAGVMVDPYDVQAITDGLIRLDTDPALRAELSRRGLVQAGRFGLTQHRAALHAVYAELLSR